MFLKILYMVGGVFLYLKDLFLQEAAGYYSTFPYIGGKTQLDFRRNRIRPTVKV